MNAFFKPQVVQKFYAACLMIYFIQTQAFSVNLCVWNKQTSSKLSYIHCDIVKSINIWSRARKWPDFLIRDGNMLKLVCGVVVSLQKLERLSTVAHKMPRFVRQYSYFANGRPGSLTRQTVQVSWQIKWHYNRYCTKFLCFDISVFSFTYPILPASDGQWNRLKRVV